MVEVLALADEVRQLRAAADGNAAPPPDLGRMASQVEAYTRELRLGAEPRSEPEEWLEQVRARAAEIQRLRVAVEAAARAATEACDQAIDALRRRHTGRPQ